MSVLARLISPIYRSSVLKAPYTDIFLDAGAAYVFAYSGGIWIQQAYLRASNAEGNFDAMGEYNMGRNNSGDQFGASVALSGDTLAIGAPGEESGVSGDESDNSARDAGAVYVFTRSGHTWIQQAYVKASNAELGNEFGTSVALYGDTLIVGAPRGASGAVYIYTRTNADWIQVAYLKASNAEAGDSFGTSVALYGDTLVVGAPWEASSASGGEGDNSAPGEGAAYVFIRTNGVWTQQDYLKASNADGNNPLWGGDRFGSSVAISRDTLAIGAPRESSYADGGESDNTAFTAGAAYVFTRNGDTWTQQVFIKASNADAGDQFGALVELSGDTLVVGAPFRPHPYGDDNWLIDNHDLVGTEFQLGSVYVFKSNNERWNQTAYIEASNADANDHFGTSIALYGNTLTVGAPLEDSGANGDEADNSAYEAGAVYVFQ